MKKTLTILVLLFTLGGCTKAQNYLLTKYGTVLPKPTPEGDTAFILYNAGQSNDAGRVDVSTNFVGAWAYLAGKINLNNDTAWIRSYNTTAVDQWEHMESGYNTSDDSSVSLDRAGIQPYFAYEWLEYRGKDIYWFQSAEGGNAITQWTQSVRAPYRFSDSGLNGIRTRFEAEGKVVKFIGAVWIQGESDGGTDTTTYKTQLDSLEKLTRIWMHDADSTVPFIVVQMIDCQTGVTLLSDLQAAQANWVVKRQLLGKAVHIMAKGIDDDGCQDTLHFDWGKQQTLAERIFQLLKNR